MSNIVITGANKGMFHLCIHEQNIQAYCAHQLKPKELDWPLSNILSIVEIATIFLHVVVPCPMNCGTWSTIVTMVIVIIRRRHHLSLYNLCHWMCNRSNRFERLPISLNKAWQGTLIIARVRAVMRIIFIIWSIMQASSFHMKHWTTFSMTSSCPVSLRTLQGHCSCGSIWDIYCRITIVKLCKLDRWWAVWDP